MSHSRTLYFWLILSLIAGLSCSPVIAAPPTVNYADARNRMVDQEIVAAGVTDSRVIAAMRSTPRHEFVSLAQRERAYFDMALAIGESQTISPPFVVAYMTEQLLPQPGEKVLEIGTGSGYQAAVLSPLVKEVYTIEIVKSLAERARRTLKRLKYQNVHTRTGDGYLGWPEAAPFDKIIVTCSPEKVPEPLIEQLREGGRMIVPVGERYQQTLYRFTKKDGKLVSEPLLPTLFVPMTGEAESTRAVKPDPQHPRLSNGDFEDILVPKTSGTTPQEPKLIGWHYQRQLKVVDGSDAPKGRHFVTFSNSEPGRGSRALQGLAIDGRAVNYLDISLRVRAKHVQDGLHPKDQASLGIIFYDQNRAEAGTAVVGPWNGTFDWRQISERVYVPAHAREAIVHLGLHGATGEISFDDVELKAAVGRKRLTSQ